jgi:hypothetical protein
MKWTEPKRWPLKSMFCLRAHIHLVSPPTILTNIYVYSIPADKRKPCKIGRSEECHLYRKTSRISSDHLVCRVTHLVCRGIQGYLPCLQGYLPGLQGYPPGLQGYPPGLQEYPPGLQGYPPGLQEYPPGLQEYPPGLQGTQSPIYYWVPWDWLPPEVLLSTRLLIHLCPAGNENEAGSLVLFTAYSQCQYWMLAPSRTINCLNRLPFHKHGCRLSCGGMQ